MVDRCVMCGDIIPEGRQVCPSCEDSAMKHELPYRVSKEKGGRYFVHTNTLDRKVVPGSFGDKKSACKLAAKLCGISYKDYIKCRKEEMRNEDNEDFE